MNFDNPINPAGDLGDPAQVAALCESMAGGLDQQAMMARTGTAMGGHPDPSYLYGHSAEALRAAAALIRSRLVGANTPTPQPKGDEHPRQAPLNVVTSDPLANLPMSPPVAPPEPKRPRGRPPKQPEAAEATQEAPTT